MKFTITWLEKFLDLEGIAIEKIAEALTEIGLEVESISSTSPLLDQFIVAQITECYKHPDAEKLNVCSVNDGKNILNIVCGASNVRSGLNIVLAPIGSLIPANNITIEKRKIRGIESEGMICSSAELGLEGDADGIIELDSDLKIGKRFVDECPWAKDIVIDISITPNRGDCLGIYGIARDLAAYGIGKLKPLPKPKATPSSYSSPIHIRVSNTRACPLFIGSYIKNLDNSKPSPSWLSKALNSIGEKSISPIVDITNYINYAFGRPLHAFDADKLEGNLHVRLAKKGEEMLSLSGDKLSLEEQDIVVADDNKICALGGIIGGENSKCTSETKNVFLEAAIFDKQLIAKTGQRTKIQSSAKYRNERGLDFDFTLDGIEIALDMVNEICGGEASDLVIMGNPVSQKRSIDFDQGLIEKLGGTIIEPKMVNEILESLGFKLDGNTITVPSWRNDVAIPQDIVEEVLRINGYDKIPSLPNGTTKAINSVTIPRDNTLILQTRSMLAALGFDEMITWSFMSSKIAKIFGLLETSPTLANPITAELDVMRASIIPNLLSSVHKNNARAFNDLSLFEIGNIFENKNFSQTQIIAAVRSGRHSEENIFKDSRNFDFFDIKGDILQLLETVFNINQEDISFATGKALPNWYHPGKSAIISIDNKVIGHLGEIHPTILKEMDIHNPTLAFELFVNEIPYRDSIKSISFSDYQMVSRDFAFIVDNNVPALKLIESIKSIDSKLIKTINIFDLFTGPTIGENKKSIAIRVTLQGDDHPLTETEISKLSSKIIEKVTESTGATLR